MGRDALVCNTHCITMHQQGSLPACYLLPTRVLLLTDAAIPSTIQIASSSSAGHSRASARGYREPWAGLASKCLCVIRWPASFASNAPGLGQPWLSLARKADRRSQAVCRYRRDARTLVAERRLRWLLRHLCLQSQAPTSPLHTTALLNLSFSHVMHRDATICACSDGAADLMYWPGWHLCASAQPTPRPRA